MRKTLPVEDLARDSRFVKINIEEVIVDRGDAADRQDRRTGFDANDPDSPDGARGLMHGIFVGEIQALEGAGRTCWDFDTGTGREEVTFAMKLARARQG